MSYTNGLDKPTDYFNTVIYNGNGSTQSITGVGFQPDFVWGKARSGTDAVYNHALYNSVIGATKTLRTNNDTYERTLTAGLTSFDSDGFSLGNDGHMNLSGNANVAWNWKANGAGSSNTDGSITSTVSANTTSGFSIVSYTGNGVADATIGHGLNDTLAMIILKNRTDAENWWVYHKGLSDPSTKAILLNSTNAEFTPGTSAFNPSGFSTSVFSTKNDNASNSSGDNYIAYCFAEKKGFSKFGSYIASFISGQATPNATGTPFVYTGFKPAFIMIKNSSSAENWVIFDNKRSPQNASYGMLFPNSNVVENTSEAIDIYSNGFKPRSNSGYFTVPAGDKFIYMAFAESPFVTSTGIPTTAR